MGSSVILPSPGQPATGPDPNFKQGAIPNLVQFKFRHLDPPAAVYIQRDDVLVMQGLSIIAPETVLIFGRLLLPYAPLAGQPDTQAVQQVTEEQLTGPGVVQPFAGRLVLPVSGTSGLVTIPLLEGYLLSLTVTAANATRRGQTFARAWLNRGATVSPPTQAGTILFGDYVTQQQVVGWPFGRVLSAVEGPGNISFGTVVNPAAGADFAFSTLNTNGRTRVASLKATLTTSATVANRFPSFTITDVSSGILHYQVQDTAAVPASTTVTYSLVPGGTNVRGGGAPIFVTLPLPSPEIDINGATLASSTQGLQVGDQWSAISFGTETWEELV